MADNLGERDVVDGVSEYTKKQAEVLQKKNYQRFNKSLLSAARQNRRRKMEVLLQLVKHDAHVSLHLSALPDLLRTSMLFTHHGYETCELIVQEYPEQLFTVTQSQETILHIAVARQDIPGARLVLESWKGSERGEVLLHKYIHLAIECGEGHRGLMNSCMEVELPLSMAAWNCDIEMIDLLVDYGASMKEVNSRKQNVFHSLVEVAADPEYQRNLEQLQETLQHLIDKAMTTPDAAMFGLQNLSVILSERDVNGYTPLTLAAQKGSREMFTTIVNCDVYKILDTLNGVSDVYMYDVTEIDSAISNDGKSAMELVMAGSYVQAHKYYEFAEICPMLNLIRAKWNYYKYWYFGWGALHFALMVLYTAGALNNTDLPPIRAKDFNTSIQMNEPYSKTIPNLIFDLLMLLYSSLITIQEIYQLLRWKNIQLTNEIRNGPYRVLLVLFGLSTMCTVIMQFFSMVPSKITRSLSLIFGWMFTAFFTRGIKQFSSFTVMMQMALGDVMRFIAVFFLVLIPYSASMTILFNPSTGNEHNYQNFGKSLLTMFLMTLGLAEPDSFQASPYPSVAIILHVTFLITAYVLLLNMMIALLSDTCSRVSSIRQDQWHLQKLGIVLYIEARLLKRHTCVCGQIEAVKLFQQESISESNSQTPRQLDPQLLPKHLQHERISHHPVDRFYLKVKTFTQRSVAEFRSKARPLEKAVKQWKTKVPNITRNDPGVKLEHRENIIAADSDPFNQTCQHDLPMTYAPERKDAPSGTVE